MHVACACAVFLRRVLPVVAGQVEVSDVQVRVGAMHAQRAEKDLRGPLGDGQMRLVVLMVLVVLSAPGALAAAIAPAFGAACCGGTDFGETRQAGPNAAGGEVLDPAVVFVPPGVLAYLGNGQIPE